MVQWMAVMMGFRSANKLAVERAGMKEISLDQRWVESLESLRVDGKAFQLADEKAALTDSLMVQRMVVCLVALKVEKKAAS